MMRTHNLMTLAQLSEKPRSKQEVFEGLEGSFDYAMPQGWLNGFSDWCKTHCPEVTYDLIRSTTVWHYKPERDSMGRPCTCSLEVARAYLEMERVELGDSDVIYIYVNFMGWKLAFRKFHVHGTVWFLESDDPRLSFQLTKEQANEALSVIHESSAQVTA